MKSPNHPVPSGDRSMARLLFSALRRAGHEPVLVSQLRSYEGHGELLQQQRIQRRAGAVRHRLLERFKTLPAWERPALWFSYHLYHKAPDLLGPSISRALGIPYVVAEASHAPKQATGPWAAGFEAAREAMLSAARIIALNPVDAVCVETLLTTENARAVEVARLSPFIDARRIQRWSGQRAACRQLARELNLDPGIPVLICVAMMRRHSKLASYGLLAQALTSLAHRPWQLIIVGDGDAGAEVRTLFSGLPGRRVKFAGRHNGRHLAHYLGLADLFVWPAINEAWGMVFMEAAAAGLPCVAGATGGVAQVVSHQGSGLLVPAGDTRAFSSALAELLDKPGLRRELAQGAAAKAFAEHDLDTAAVRLKDILSGL